MSRLKRPNGGGNADWNVEPGKCLELEEGRDDQVVCLSNAMNNRQRVSFYVTPTSRRVDVSDGTWRIYLNDEGDVTNGHYDCWSNNGEFLDDVDPSITITSLAAGRAVIAVGASSVRNRWPSLAGEIFEETIVGELAPFSSRGPTLDGRRKPDIVAGGNRVVVSSSTADGTDSGIVDVPPNATRVSSDEEFTQPCVAPASPRRRSRAQQPSCSRSTRRSTPRRFVRC